LGNNYYVWGASQVTPHDGVAPMLNITNNKYNTTSIRTNISSKLFKQSLSGQLRVAVKGLYNQQFYTGETA